jgi:Phage portal protein
VKLLSDSAAVLPLHAYRRTETGRERVTSGRLVELLDNPGAAMTQADLVSTLMAHEVVYGAAYLAKYRQQGEIAQLGLLHPEQVWPELKNGRLRFRYDPGSGPQRLLTEAYVTYIRGLSMDGVHGLSAVSQASRVLGLSDELVKHALAYFGYETGGVGDSMGAFRPQPAGLLRVSGDMSNEARDRYLEHLRSEAKAHGILVSRARRSSRRSPRTWTTVNLWNSGAWSPKKSPGSSAFRPTWLARLRATRLPTARLSSSHLTSSVSRCRRICAGSSWRAATTAISASSGSSSSSS